VLSPITRDNTKSARGGTFRTFNPYALERVLTYPRQATKAGTFEYYLKYVDEYPGTRCVSDGNPQIAAVPKLMKSQVDPVRARKYGQTVQFYSLEASKGGAGSGLSVQ